MIFKTSVMCQRCNVAFQKTHPQWKVTDGWQMSLTLMGSKGFCYVMEHLFQTCFGSTLLFRGKNHCKSIRSERLLLFHDKSLIFSTMTGLPFKGHKEPLNRLTRMTAEHLLEILDQHVANITCQMVCHKQPHRFSCNCDFTILTRIPMPCSIIRQHSPPPSSKHDKGDISFPRVIFWQSSLSRTWRIRCIRRNDDVLTLHVEPTPYKKTV